MALAVGAAGLGAVVTIPLTGREATPGQWRYLIEIGIGTPYDQRIPLLFDTGSHQGLLLRDAERGACDSPPAAHGRCFERAASESFRHIDGPCHTSVAFRLGMTDKIRGRCAAGTDVITLSPSTPEASPPLVQPSMLALISERRDDGAGGGARDRGLPYTWADASGIFGAALSPDGAWASMLAQHGNTCAPRSRRDIELVEMTPRCVRARRHSHRRFALDLNRNESSALTLGPSFYPSGSYGGDLLQWSEVTRGRAGT